MKKPREFWTNPDADYRTDHILTKEEHDNSSFYSKEDGWILVREVMPPPTDAEIEAAANEALERQIYENGGMTVNKNHNLYRYHAGFIEGVRWALERGK